MKTSIILSFPGAMSPITSYVNVLGHVSVCASIFMIVALSYERHFAICSPHAYRIHLRTVPRWKHLINYIIPVILVAVVFNIPMFINLQVSAFGKVSQVQRFMKQQFSYDIFPVMWKTISFVVMLWQLIYFWYFPCKNVAEIKQ